MAKTLRSSKRKTFVNSLVTSAAFIAGLVLVNIVFSATDARLDVSSSGFYSLTEASKQLVRSADETIQVTAYFGKLPEENAFDQSYVESLLDRYAEASHGKLEWTKIDPFERGSEYMQQLKEDENIDKILWVSTVDGAVQQVPVYFQVQFKYLDKSLVWAPPGRFSLEGLEYKFSSLIRQLVLPKRKVAITTGLGCPPQAGAMRLYLSELYEVSMVDLADEGLNFADYDVLVVNGPSEPLGNPQLQAIDQFVQAGKPTLFLWRGFTFRPPGANPQMPPEFQGQQPTLGMPTQSGLDKLLAHYGVAATPNVIADPQVNTAGLMVSGGDQLLVNPLFPLAEVLANGSNEPLAGLSAVPIPIASSLELTPQVQQDAAIRTTPLLRTSSAAFLQSNPIPITRASQFVRGDNPGGPFHVGFALEGAFSAYSPAGAESGGTVSPSGTRMIVLGTADFVDDAYMRMAQHPVFQNLAMGQLVLQNMVDWLAADQSLVAARTKQAPPPMVKPSSDTRNLLKFGNSLGVALLILLVGAGSRMLRERRRRTISL